MPLFDQGLAADVADLIADVARQVTVRRTTQAADAGAPNRPSGGSTIDDYPVPAMVTLFRLSQIDGNTVQANDRMVHIDPAALAIVPATSDAVVVDGDEHQIVGVKTIAPGSTALLHTLHIR